MLSPELIQWLVGQTGVTGVAALALLILKSSYEERLREHREERKRIVRLHDRTLDALSNNTEALTKFLRYVEERS